MELEWKMGLGPKHTPFTFDMVLGKRTLSVLQSNPIQY